MHFVWDQDEDESVFNIDLLASKTAMYSVCNVKHCGCSRRSWKVEIQCIL